VSLSKQAVVLLQLIKLRSVS